MLAYINGNLDDILGLDNIMKTCSRPGKRMRRMAGGNGIHLKAKKNLDEDYNAKDTPEFCYFDEIDLT